MEHSEDNQQVEKIWHLSDPPKIHGKTSRKLDTEVDKRPTGASKERQRFLAAS